MGSVMGSNTVVGGVFIFHPVLLLAPIVVYSAYNRVRIESEDKLIRLLVITIQSIESLCHGLLGLLRLAHNP